MQQGNTMEPSANRFSVFTEGDALYQDMLATMSTARESICLESYIFEPDVIGRAFVDCLVARARAGVHVRVHLDAFGSMAMRISKEDDRLREAGVELRWFNSWRWYSPLKFNRRNHRKLLVVDGRTAWLGGFNIHIDNSLENFGESRWRDTQVRIDGDLAAEAGLYFDKLWNDQRRWQPVVHDSAESFLVSNHNWLQRHRFRRLLVARLHSARERVWLSTPYFMPDMRTQAAMARTAKRGVDVRLLVPFKTDRPMTQLAARAAYGSLLAAGVRIFEYQPRILHAKTAVVDQGWCTIGTANLDYRSFFVNFELNLVSGEQPLVKRLAGDFECDLRMADEVTPTIWAERSLLRRIGEIIGWIARRIL